MSLEGSPGGVPWERVHPTAVVGGDLHVDLAGIEWVDESRRLFSSEGRRGALAGGAPLEELRGVFDAPNFGHYPVLEGVVLVIVGEMTFPFN